MANRRQFRWVLRGVSFSGRERNCCFLNMAGERFADVSAVSGIDFPDDARAIGRVDWDLDGDLDLWIANRSGPQLRFLRNDMNSDHHYVALRLEGRTCNRDAIGARIELSVKGNTPQMLVHTLRAGDGYLSQSSKWVHVGIGSATEVRRLVVHWPGGDREEFSEVRVDQRQRIVQGTARAQPWRPQHRDLALYPSELAASPPSDSSQVFLAAPLPLPRLHYQDFDQRRQVLRPLGDRPLLLNLWASWCQPCLVELDELARNRKRLNEQLDIIALSVDGLGDDRSAPAAAEATLRTLKFPYATGRATSDLVEKLHLVDQLIFEARVPLPIPTSLLLNGQGDLVAVYKGPVGVERLLDDVKSAQAGSAPPTSRAFVGRWLRGPMRARLLPLAWDLVKRGFMEDALEYISRNGQHLQADREYAKLLALTGYELLEKGDILAAARQYSAAIEADPTTTVAHLNLALARIRQGDYAAAAGQYRDALRHQPQDVRIHYCLAWLLATAPDASVRNGVEAVRWAEQAARTTKFRHIATLESLAAAYAEAGRFADAVHTARRVIEMAEEANERDIVTRTQDRLRLYENAQPYHEPPPDVPE